MSRLLRYIDDISDIADTLPNNLMEGDSSDGSDL